jgi:hypothetical protein
MLLHQITYKMGDSCDVDETFEMDLHFGLVLHLIV